MSEELEQTTRLSRRDVLRAAAAAGAALARSHEAKAQTPEPIKDVTVVGPFGVNSFTVPERGTFDFPREGILKWVRDELLKDKNFITGLSAVPHFTHSQNTARLVWSSRAYADVSMVEFRRMTPEQRALWLDYYRGEKFRADQSSPIEAIDVEAVQPQELSGTNQYRIRIRFSGLPASRRIVVLLNFNVTVGR